MNYATSVDQCPCLCRFTLPVVLHDAPSYYLVSRSTLCARRGQPWQLQSTSLLASSASRLAQRPRAQLAAPSPCVAAAEGGPRMMGYTKVSRAERYDLITSISSVEPDHRSRFTTPHLCKSQNQFLTFKAGTLLGERAVAARRALAGQQVRIATSVPRRALTTCAIVRERACRPRAGRNLMRRPGPCCAYCAEGGSGRRSGRWGAANRSG